MKRVAVILADGFEEIEAIEVIDILRRATCKVEILGHQNLQVTGARGVTIECDDRFNYYTALDFDGVVLVGGMANANTLSEDREILNLLEAYNKQGKMIAGICATPAVVFSDTTILNGKKCTCYPDNALMVNLGGEFVDAPCVVDGNIITSQSPATAMEFALTIVEYLGYNAGQLYSDLQGK